MNMTDSSTIVRLTGNQTIAGIKTFSSSPIVPTPTTNFQVATKKYVDDIDALKINKKGKRKVCPFFVALFFCAQGFACPIIIMEV